VKPGSSPAAAREIRTRARTTCPCCGGPGVVLHARLADRLFGTSGEWGYRRCSDVACGLAWIDPVPVEQDLALAYRGYYTHAPPVEAGPTSRARPSGVGGLATVLWAATSIARERSRLDAFLLDTRAPGRVLEIGCGTGERLVRLRERGWEVEGQEIDPPAAAVTVERLGRSARVHVGPLEELALPASSYDAVVSSHVLEHVYDPAAVLCEARRILRADGVLTAITPNVASLGHRLFGRDWFYLDPPRHLQLFTPRALTRLAHEAGFDPEVRTTPARAETVAAGSLDLRRRADTRARRSLRDLLATAYQGLAIAGARFAPGSGEECVLVAVPARTAAPTS
jgi:SAM-dependent methyltransferase